jgi:hypothetical protein
MVLPTFLFARKIAVGVFAYYRGLNRVTVRNQHPLRRIEEMFEQLNGSVVFSKLDLALNYDACGKRVTIKL